MTMNIAIRIVGTAVLMLGASVPAQAVGTMAPPEKVSANSTFGSPLNFEYCFLPDATSGREAADPFIVPFKSFYARETFFPDLIEQDGSLDVPQTVLGDFAEAPGLNEIVDVAAGDAAALGRGDAEGLAIEVEVEPPGGTFASADPIKGQLIGEVAMGLDLVAVAQPIFAGDGDF